MKTKKSAIIADFKQHESDTGSIEVQIALITTRIKELTEHFKKHAKDFSSKRGLILLVGQRRRYLKYLERTDDGTYKKVIERLGLRK